MPDYTTFMALTGQQGYRDAELARDLRQRLAAANLQGQSDQAVARTELAGDVLGSIQHAAPVFGGHNLAGVLSGLNPAFASLDPGYSVEADAQRLAQEQGDLALALARAASNFADAGQRPAFSQPVLSAANIDRFDPVPIGRGGRRPEEPGWIPVDEANGVWEVSVDEWDDYTRRFGTNTAVQIEQTRPGRVLVRLQNPDAIPAVAPQDLNNDDINVVD